MLREEVLAEGEDTSNGIVLVACKDERSCLQLEECITNSSKKVVFVYVILYNKALSKYNSSLGSISDIS